MLGNGRSAIKYFQMKKQILFILTCLISVLSGRADVQVVLPWGADAPWKMNYVKQHGEEYSEPANDGTGKTWKELGYDDSSWQTLTGPMASGGSTPRIVFFFSNYSWEEQGEYFNLRRTFTLNEVNASGYTFATLHDDGIEVYINGNKIYGADSHTDGNIVTTHVAASVFRDGANQMAVFFKTDLFPDYFDYALFAGTETSIGQYDGIVINGLRYWFNDDGETAYVEGINEGVKTASILSSITVKGKDYPVTAIGRGAFAESELTSVSIPSTITRIKEEAFYHCNVEKVNITDLEAWCRIDFEGDDYDYGGNPLSTGDGKLYLNNKRVTDLVIPESITEIKRFTFRGGSLSSLTIPNTVTKIGEGAFKDCSTLRKATLNNAEGSCKLKSIGFNAFCDCSALQSINFTKYATFIGEAAFARCGSLTSIELNDGLTEILPRTFLECSKLTTVNIPNSLISIGESAFDCCGNLSSELIFPEGLTTVGIRAFASCSNIETLSLPNTLTTVDDGAFREMGKVRSLYIPSNLTSIGSQAFVGKPSALSIVVAEDNPKYDSRNNCNAIIETESGKLLAGCRNTIIPDGVTSIENAALAWLPNTIFIVPNTVEEIKEGAFAWQNTPGDYGWNFKTLVLGSGVTDIGSNICYGGAFPLDVYCYATSVPITDGEAFSWGYTSPGPGMGTLHVPAESIEEYKTTAPWSYFSDYVPITGDERFTIDLYLCESIDNSTRLNHYNGYDANVTIERTFHKDGKWNTLCLPFSMTAEQIEDGSNPLHDATIVKMEPASSSVKADGTLDMTFVRTAFIEAGNPYLVKWKEGDDLVDPTFKSVHLNCTEPTAIEFDNEQGTDPCKFVGQFSPFKVTDENIDRIVQISPDIQPYYSPEPETLYSSLAHFEILGVIKSSNFTYLGDVNNDGDIDIVDVTSTISYVIHQVPANFIFKAADVNNDGEVDIVDVTSIIDMIINKGKNVKEFKSEFDGFDPQ